MARPKSKSVLLQVRQFAPKDNCRVLEQIDKAMIVQNHELTAAKMDLISSEMRRWRIMLLWCCYEMYPNVDITRTPFQKGFFKALRENGRELYLWQQLAKGCMERDPKFRKRYPSQTPLAVWGTTMKEQKRANLLNVVRPVRTDAPVRAHKELLGNFIRALLAGNAIASDVCPCPTSDALLRSAFKLQGEREKRGVSSFKHQYWEPFVDCFRAQWESHPWKHGVIPVSAFGDELIAHKGKRKYSLDPIEVTAPARFAIPLTQPDGSIVYLKVHWGDPISQSTVFYTPDTG